MQTLSGRSAPAGHRAHRREMKDTDGEIAEKKEPASDDEPVLEGFVVVPGDGELLLRPL